MSRFYFRMFSLSFVVLAACAGQEGNEELEKSEHFLLSAYYFDEDQPISLDHDASWSFVTDTGLDCSLLDETGFDLDPFCLDPGSYTLEARFDDVTQVVELHILNVPPWVVSFTQTSREEVELAVDMSFHIVTEDPGIGPHTYVWDFCDGNSEIVVAAGEEGLRNAAITHRYSNAFASTEECTLTVSISDNYGTTLFGYDVPLRENEADVTQDTDSDGMPDIWEVFYDLNPTDPNDADEDFDGDGASNLLEFREGTNPQRFDGPSSPNALYPSHGDLVSSSPFMLMIGNASDPTGDLLTYTFEIFRESADLEVLYRVSDVPADPSGTTTVEIVAASEILPDDTPLLWHARASDGRIEGEWSPLTRFIMDLHNEPPTAPIGIAPFSVTNSLQPTLEVINATDPNDRVAGYFFEIAADEAFSNLLAQSPVIQEDHSGSTSWQVSEVLPPHDDYYWHARAFDSGNVIGPWSSALHFRLSVTNRPPETPEILAPINGERVGTYPVYVVLNESIDPDGDELRAQIVFAPYEDPEEKTVIIGAVPAEGNARIALMPPAPGMYHYSVTLTDGTSDSHSQSASFELAPPNASPGGAIPISPIEQASVDTLQPTLVARAGPDPDGDVVLHDVQLFQNEQLLLEVFDIPVENGDFMQYTVREALINRQNYTWRVRAKDENEAFGPWSETAEFEVSAGNLPPEPPVIISPLLTCLPSGAPIPLVIQNAQDPDDDPLHYNFVIYVGETIVAELENITAGLDGITRATIVDGLPDGDYYWSAFAKDPVEDGPASQDASFCIGEENKKDPGCACNNTGNNTDRRTGPFWTIFSLFLLIFVRSTSLKTRIVRLLHKRILQNLFVKRILTLRAFFFISILFFVGFLSIPVFAQSTLMPPSWLPPSASGSTEIPDEQLFMPQMARNHSGHVLATLVESSDGREFGWLRVLAMDPNETAFGYGAGASTSILASQLVIDGVDPARTWLWANESEGPIGFATVFSSLPLIHENEPDINRRRLRILLFDRFGRRLEQEEQTILLDRVDSTLHSTSVAGAFSNGELLVATTHEIGAENASREIDFYLVADENTENTGSCEDRRDCLEVPNGFFDQPGSGIVGSSFANNTWIVAAYGRNVGTGSILLYNIHDTRFGLTITPLPAINTPDLHAFSTQNMRADSAVVDLLWNETRQQLTIAYVGGSGRTIGIVVVNSAGLVIQREEFDAGSTGHHNLSLLQTENSSFLGSENANFTHVIHELSSSLEVIERVESTGLRQTEEQSVSALTSFDHFQAISITSDGIGDTDERALRFLANDLTRNARAGIVGQNQTDVSLHVQEDRLSAAVTGTYGINERGSWQVVLGESTSSGVQLNEPSPLQMFTANTNIQDIVATQSGGMLLTDNGSIPTTLYRSQWCENSITLTPNFVAITAAGDWMLTLDSTRLRSYFPDPFSCETGIINQYWDISDISTTQPRLSATFLNESIYLVSQGDNELRAQRLSVSDNNVIWNKLITAFSGIIEPGTWDSVAFLENNDGEFITRIAVISLLAGNAEYYFVDVGNVNSLAILSAPHLNEVREVAISAHGSQIYVVGANEDHVWLWKINHNDGASFELLNTWENVGFDIQNLDVAALSSQVVIAFTSLINDMSEARFLSYQLENTFSARLGEFDSRNGERSGFEGSSIHLALKDPEAVDFCNTGEYHFYWEIDDDVVLEGQSVDAMWDEPGNYPVSAIGLIDGKPECELRWEGDISVINLPPEVVAFRLLNVPRINGTLHMELDVRDVGKGTIQTEWILPNGSNYLSEVSGNAGEIRTFSLAIVLDESFTSGPMELLIAINDGSDIVNYSNRIDILEGEFVVNEDLDGDGIDDAWEQAHGLDPDDANDGARDGDGDGLTNLEEFLQGSDPWLTDAPLAPNAIYPLDHGVAAEDPIVLRCSNASDRGGETLTYEFRLYRDRALNQLVEIGLDISEGGFDTSYIVDSTLEEEEEYCWRARAHDGHAYSPFSTTACFRVNLQNNPPLAPQPVSPFSVALTNTPTFITSVFPENDGDSQRLYLEVAGDNSENATAFITNQIEVDSSGGLIAWIPEAQFQADYETYYWRARIEDAAGLWSDWSQWSGYRVKNNNQPPGPLSLLLPEDDSVIVASNLLLVADGGIDPDDDPVRIIAELQHQDLSIPNSIHVFERPNETPFELFIPILFEGFYSLTLSASDGIDDGPSTNIQLFIRPENSSPEIPVLRFPIDGEAVDTRRPTLEIGETNDAEDDNLVFDIELFDDGEQAARITTIYAAQANLDGSVSITLPIILENGQRYAWRARANDDFGGISEWSSFETFVVDAENDLPNAPTLLSPVLSSLPVGGGVVFEIQNATDPDGDPLNYLFEIARDAEMNDIIETSNNIIEGDGITRYDLREELPTNHYYWRVTASDGIGSGPASEIASFDVVSPYKEDPNGCACSQTQPRASYWLIGGWIMIGIFARKRRLLSLLLFTIPLTLTTTSAQAQTEVNEDHNNEDHNNEDRAFELADEAGAAFEADNFDLAIDLLDQAYEIAPLPDFLVNKAIVLEEAGRFEESLEVLQQNQAQILTRMEPDAYRDFENDLIARIELLSETNSPNIDETPDIQPNHTVSSILYGAAAVSLGVAWAIDIPHVIEGTRPDEEIPMLAAYSAAVVFGTTAFFLRRSETRKANTTVVVLPIFTAETQGFSLSINW